MIIRKAVSEKDVAAAAAIYEEIHTEEEAGRTTIGWVRGVYPTIEDARSSCEKGELFVMLEGGEVIASARINREQVDVYADAKWSVDAPEDEVMVLHTLTVSPRCARKGYGAKFVQFYEIYALQNGCRYLRIDTNERNETARKMYAKLGYTEVGTVPCVFNNIRGVNLVCLEKIL